MIRKQERIQALKQDLEKEIFRKKRKLKSKISQMQMKERNKRLLAYGVLLERKFKQAGAKERQEWTEMAEKRLKGWQLTRACAGFADIEKRFPPALPSAAVEADETENHSETNRELPLDLRAVSASEPLSREPAWAAAWAAWEGSSWSLTGSIFLDFLIVTSVFVGILKLFI